MRLSMVFLITGALAWGCSSDEEGVNEAVGQHEASSDEEANLAGTGDDGSMPAAADNEEAGAEPGEGQDGAWQEAAGEAASVAVEAANDLKESVTANNDSYSVTAAALNVRRGPGTQHAKTRTLRKGESVSALERSGSWVRIGEQEWVSGAYLTK